MSVRRCAALGAASPPERPRIEAALGHLIGAETCCNLYWGEAWVPRCLADLDDAHFLLDA